MPDDVAIEKVHALQALGADVERVRPASIVDKKQASCAHFTLNWISQVNLRMHTSLVCGKFTFIPLFKRKASS